MKRVGAYISTRGLRSLLSCVEGESRRVGRGSDSAKRLPEVVRVRASRFMAPRLRGSCSSGDIVSESSESSAPRADGEAWRNPAAAGSPRC